MSSWSIDFSPMVPAPLFWAGVVLAAVLVALLLLRRSRGALLRALSLAALLLALANPTLRQEERESLANIAIVVVDESTEPDASPAGPSRPRPSGASWKPSSAASRNLQVRWVTSSQADRRDGVRHQPVHRPQQRARQHPARPAGRRHHDHRRPGARRAEVGADAGLRCPRARPAHRRSPTSSTAASRCCKAPRYGIVGSDARHRGARGRDRPQGPRRRPRHAQDPPRRPARRDAPDARSAAPCTIQMPFPHAGQNIVEIELETAPGELTAANNRVVVAAEGVRENLRVLLVSGEPHAGERVWRNLLEVGRRRRPRALHHSAPAAEAGRHADPPALADRLPDARAVLGEDQGLRPHHLRPLPAPRHPAAALLREHRPLRGAGRRAAGRRRRRLSPAT